MKIAMIEKDKDRRWYSLVTHVLCCWDDSQWQVVVEELVRQGRTMKELLAEVKKADEEFHEFASR